MMTFKAKLTITVICSESYKFFLEKQIIQVEYNKSEYTYICICICTLTVHILFIKVIKILDFLKLF